MRDLSEHLEDGVELFADLPGRRTFDSPSGTIPDNLIVTSARPDMVLVENQSVKDSPTQLAREYAQS